MSDKSHLIRPLPLCPMAFALQLCAATRAVDDVRRQLQQRDEELQALRTSRWGTSAQGAGVINAECPRICKADTCLAPLPRTPPFHSSPAPHPRTPPFDGAPAPQPRTPILHTFLAPLFCTPSPHPFPGHTPYSSPCASLCFSSAPTNP